MGYIHSAFKESGSGYPFGVSWSHLFLPVLIRIRYEYAGPIPAAQKRIAFNCCIKICMFTMQAFEKIRVRRIAIKNLLKRIPMNQHCYLFWLHITVHRIILCRAVECCPTSTELWIALARLGESLKYVTSKYLPQKRIVQKAVHYRVPDPVGSGTGFGKFSPDPEPIGTGILGM